MPYRLEKQGEQWCVINSQTGRNTGCSKTRGMAVKHMRALYAAEPSARTAALTARSAVITDEAGEPIGVWTPTIDERITAAVSPIAPPAEWFTTPEPDAPTPVTVTADGHVYGHLALWDSCHVGLMNGSRRECVKPPPSRNDFRSFHLGELVTEDGSPISVGRMVVGTPHAPITAGLEGAQAHYDQTGAVAAFVRARNGKHGIFISGAVKSDATPEQIRDLRANPPSGDWRMLNGNLELIASLAVPVPGYPVPRVGIAASANGEADVVEALIMAEDFDQEEEVVKVERTKDYIRQRSMVSREIQNDPLTAAVLTTKARKSLSRSAFAIPETREYPIHDEAHARDALARSSGKPEEGRVRRAVCRRYPNMGECKSK